MSQDVVQFLAAGLFAIAVLHTFSTRVFERLAHRSVAHSGFWHLLGEVEVAFGLWAMVLVLAMMAALGRGQATDYLDSRNFTEPLFVFAVMVVAGSRPILRLAEAITVRIARALPLGAEASFYFAVLAVVPLLGSFITEPAAMTLAALILRDRFLAATVSTRFKYATIGVLFVNISIGGTLTPFAAPPVLMVAAKWGWDLPFMLATFGWKVALAVGINALAVTLLFRRELAGLRTGRVDAPKDTPHLVIAAHVGFLAGIVAFSHHPEIFLGLLLFFLGFASAYERYQDRLMIREGLMVAFFLAGLVVLGGQQQWWLSPLLHGMDDTTVYYGAAALAAITDNAALTYLGGLVEGTSEEFRYALVAGAITGGGLTVIANAPNPAGFAILRDRFEDGAISALGLLVAAIPPTLVAVVALRMPSDGVKARIVELMQWARDLPADMAFLFLLPFGVAVVALAGPWLGVGQRPEGE